MKGFVAGLRAGLIALLLAACGSGGSGRALYVTPTNTPCVSIEEPDAIVTRTASGTQPPIPGRADHPLDDALEVAGRLQLLDGRVVGRQRPRADRRDAVLSSRPPVRAEDADLRWPGRRHRLRQIHTRRPRNVLDGVGRQARASEREHRACPCTGQSWPARHSARPAPVSRRRQVSERLGGPGGGGRLIRPGRLWPSTRGSSTAGDSTPAVGVAVFFESPPHAANIATIASAHIRTRI